MRLLSLKKLFEYILIKHRVKIFPWKDFVVIAAVGAAAADADADAMVATTPHNLFFLI